MRWPHLLVVLTVFMASAAAAEQQLFDGLLTFGPPMGDVEETHDPGGRSLVYRDREGDYHLMWGVHEYASAGNQSADDLLKDRLRSIDSLRSAGTRITTVGSATVGPAGSLVIVSQYEGSNAQEPQRKWYADTALQGHWLHIEIAMLPVGDNSLVPKDAAGMDAGVEAFLASFKTKAGEQPFGTKAVHEALAAGPGAAAAGGKKAPEAKGAKAQKPAAAGQRQLFDGLLTFTPPTGEETDQVASGQRCYGYHDASKPYELRWSVTETNSRREPPTDLLARQLRGIDILRQAGQDKAVVGSATVGSSGCLVITSWFGGQGNVHWAHRAWSADGVAGEHVFHVELFMDQQVPKLQPKDVDQADAACEAVLASFMTKDGDQPFGKTPVHDVLAVARPEERGAGGKQAGKGK